MLNSTALGEQVGREPSEDGKCGVSRADGREDKKVHHQTQLKMSGEPS